MSKYEKMLATLRFLAKMCFYFKHFLYLCIRIIIIYLVTFVDCITRKFWELCSFVSNVTCKSREANCLVPLLYRYGNRIYQIVPFVDERPAIL